MSKSTQTHELLPDGNAAAECRVVGLALMVVGVCWFFRFLPYFVLFFIVQLPVPWGSNHYSFTEFGIKSVITFAGAGIVLGSICILKCHRYWIAFLAPLICLLLLVFSCLAVYHTYRHSHEYTHYENLDYLDNRHTHPYYHPMDGMIPTGQVMSIASYFADYTPRHCCDVRHYPKIEIPVNITLFFLTPTTLFGLFGLFTLLKPGIRRSFSVPFSQRVKMSSADEKIQFVWRRGLSRTYAVLMSLLLLALVPTILLDFLKPDQYEYLMPPVNVHLNYAIFGCMMIGIISYFTRLYYFFALLTPFAWFASIAFFRWQIAWEYQMFTCGAYSTFDPATWTFCSMILIVLVSRFTFGGLGLWIWWKNWKRRGTM